MKITYHITREDFIDAQKLHRAKGGSAFVRGLILFVKVFVVAVPVGVIVLAA